MTTSHPVRVARSRSARPVRVPADTPDPDGALAGERRPNRGGTQRALRTGTLFVLAMLVLYAGLGAYDRAGPGGTSSGAEQGFVWFTLLAAAIATAGFVLSLAVAPRSVELRPQATIVVGRFGRVHRFAAGASYGVKVLRRYPTGLLSSREVESVEIRAGALRRTYLLEADLVPETPAGTE